MFGKTALWALLFASAGLKGQMSTVPAQLDVYLNSALHAGKYNGVALVAQQGHILLHKAYGWKNVAAQQPNDTGTIFPILSITKPFTAMVMLKLQEEGLLSLQDKLSQYFPDFPNGANITLAHLLQHTSGLYNYTDDIGGEDSALFSQPVQKTFIINLIAKKPPMHAPGEDLSYNNSGYYLAGNIIEKVTGKPYEQVVRELIFEPLQMRHSGFDFNSLPANAKATGYRFLNKDVQQPYTYLDSTISFSAGGIYSTAADMYQWARAIAKKQVLSPASWELAFTRKAGDYGTGFRLNNYFGNGYIRHSGGYPGFVSEFLYYPEKDVTIILLKNSGNYGEDLFPVAMGLSSIALGLPYDLWKLRKPVKLAEDVLRQREGEYVADKLVIRFTVKDGQLYEILPGGAALPLLAESSGSFYLENFNTSLHFTNTDGVETVTIHEHGKDFVLKKARAAAARK